MDDIIDIVNDATSETAKQEEARQEAALAEWREQEAARLKAAYRRADAKLILRAVGFAAFVGGLIAAGRAGLIAPVLWSAFLLSGFTWMGFHFGAWFQFRARKEDKLYG